MENNFASFAEQCADRAGDIARAAFAQTHSITQKADKSFVTDTDKAIETALRKMIIAAYPDHGIFGEEHGRVNESAHYQWVIDPIDGTSAFIAGIPTFTTLIALCEDGVPTLGIIDQPILRERWSSHNLTASTKHQALSTFLLATTSTDYFTPDERDAFERVRAQAGATIRHGDAYLYAKLASGSMDVVMDAGLKPYDFCALAPVVTASGGIITDWQGNPITLQSNGQVLACANKELHANILKILALVI